MKPRTQWMVWYAIVLHTWWAVMLAADPRAINTTTLHGFVGLVPPRPLAVCMVIIAALAAVPLVRRSIQPFDIGWMLPQQAFLIASAWSAASAMLASKFGDGVIRPRAFISADQAPAVVAVALHSLAVIDRWTVGRRLARALADFDRERGVTP